MWIDDTTVAATFTGLTGYPTEAPYHPPEKYPEYQGTDLNPNNQVYAGVRQTLYNLGLDRENYGTAAWNPFKNIIKPGMTVFIKPNTVRHYHVDGKDILSVITHGSVVRPMLDYIRIALKDEGRIIMGDSQTVWGHYDAAQELSGIGPLMEWFAAQTPIPVENFDLRMVRAVRTYLGGRWKREKVELDPRGYKVVDVGERSAFKGIDPKKLRIGVASYKETYRRHSEGRHEYIFPASLLESDVIINIPKLKTHRRGGITLATKGFFGLVSAKECLPHWMLGSPEEGGDQYPKPSMRKRLQTYFQDQMNATDFVPAQAFHATLREFFRVSYRMDPNMDNVNEAMWPGNDTLWRTLLDVYQAVLFSDKDGKLRDTPQRDHFCMIDGIIGGESDGPISPDPVYPGVLVAGRHPTAIDAVASTLMGFDIQKLPMVHRAIDLVEGLKPTEKGFLNQIEVMDDGTVESLDEFAGKRNLHYKPHPDWVGILERE